MNSLLHSVTAPGSQRLWRWYQPREESRAASNGIKPHKKAEAEHYKQLQAWRNDGSSDPHPGRTPGFPLRKYILIMKLLRAGITSVCKEQAA